MIACMHSCIASISLLGEGIYGNEEENVHQRLMKTIKQNADETIDEDAFFSSKELLVRDESTSQKMYEETTEIHTWISKESA